MSITRSQIARQLMAEGGAPRQGYFLGKIVKKFKEDIIPNELKSPAGVAAALTAANFAPKFIPGGSDQTLLQRFLPRVSEGLETARGSVSNIFRGGSTPAGTTGGPIDKRTGEPFPNPNDDKSFISKVGSGIGSAFNFLKDYPELASIGAGLVAGAFSKKEDDPLYTGQSVGLNLRDIRKLANISDQKTGAAIGLNFLPDTKFRKFSPTEMAATYAANQPVDFTEQRESAEEGGIMGNQEDFNKFLEDMKKRDYGRMREQILRDYEEFMRRKRMINQRPEVKDGGMIKEAEKYATEKESEFLKNVDMSNIPGTGNLQREQERAYDNAYKEYMKRNTKADGGIMEQFKMASAPDPAAERNSYLEMMSERLYGKPLKDLTPDEFMDLEEALDDMGMKPMPKGRTMAAGGGLMNLGGMEMDLRGGGFVPIGAKEKADDVPARLSKNEFVFTADAVRAAGGGSVDKGADKMYATMKALENKVA